MKKYTKEEFDFINSLNRPVINTNDKLINSIIDKMLFNKSYEELIYFLNNLYDFWNVPKGIVNRLINDDNKECISVFLDNEDILYFFNKNEIDKLKKYLNVYEINFKLNDTYEYYYNLLFKKNVRLFSTNNINENIKEYIFMKGNVRIGIKLKEIKDIGLVVSYVNYLNYGLSYEEQVIKCIDYLNEYGFNVDRKNIIDCGE